MPYYCNHITDKARLVRIKMFDLLFQSKQQINPQMRAICYEFQMCNGHVML